MELINAARMIADYTMATDKDGREWVVVVAKGTYGIPDHPDREPVPLKEQVPLITRDLFTGEPGFSAPLYEIDFALRKPRCDVLFNGSCYAPGGKPTTKVLVGIRVGLLTKSFNVVGNRVWRSSMLHVGSSSPEPFTTMPLSYNNAYGGVDKPNEEPKNHKWYPLNHVGLGYHPKAHAGMPLPNTEEIGDAVSCPDGSYKPMAFGPLGRSWQQRIKWAGTYNQKWRDDTFPFLPDDFDERYFQCAPEDQQMGYLNGGEEVVMINLTPQGRTTFRLPANFWLPLLFFFRKGGVAEVSAVVDTVLLEPDAGRFVLVWRASFPLRRNIREVSQVILGQAMGKAEWAAKGRGAASINGSNP